MSVASTPVAGDLAAALLSHMIRTRGVQSEASQAEIQHNSELVERARAELEDALARAGEARDDAGFFGELASFFGGEVAAILGVVAAAAAVAATGGAAAPAVVLLAGAGLSTASSVGEELGLPPLACRLLGAAGALASLAAGNAGAAGGLATAARTAQAGAAGVSAGATVAARRAEASAQHADADAKSAEGHEADALFRIDLALGILERAAKELERGGSTAAALAASEHHDNSRLIAKIGANP